MRLIIPFMVFSLIYYYGIDYELSNHLFIALPNGKIKMIVIDNRATILFRRKHAEKSPSDI